jgi:transposase-like protein
MNCSKSASNETIYTNDFELEKFSDEIVKGWVLSRPTDKPITRKDFNDWLNQFNSILKSSADDYFKRVEIIKKNLGVLKNESL